MALGTKSSAILWGIFWVGECLSSMMFGFARDQVDMIYGMPVRYSIDITCMRFGAESDRTPHCLVALEFLLVCLGVESVPECFGLQCASACYFNRTAIDWRIRGRLASVKSVMDIYISLDVEECLYA